MMAHDSQLVILVDVLQLLHFLLGKLLDQEPLFLEMLWELEPLCYVLDETLLGFVEEAIEDHQVLLIGGDAH